MAVIALCLSAAMSDAATNGITVYHKFVGTHDSMTHTCWQAANGTAYDKAVIYGPDGGTITKTSALHKTLSGVGPKIGEVTPNTNGGTGGGGDDGKLHLPDGGTPSGS